MIFNPFDIQVPIRWASQPVSIACAVFHSASLLSLSSSGSSIIFPVTISTAFPANRKASTEEMINMSEVGSSLNMESI